MNSVILEELKNEQTALLKQYGLDSDGIQEFKSKMKTVTAEVGDELGKNLLELIAKKGFNDDYEKALELIYNGANIEYKNEKKGDFALLICARKNYFKTFISLIKAGANINQVNHYRTTATMASARHGHREMLEILILMGADINARCLDGDNAIMSAKRHEQEECFARLLQAQAYLNNRNLANQTIMDIPGNINLDPRLLGDDSSEPSISESDVSSSIEEAEQTLNQLIKGLKINGYQN